MCICQMLDGLQVHVLFTGSVCSCEREVNSFHVDQVLLIKVLTQCWDY